jgi:hypothetical protein
METTLISFCKIFLLNPIFASLKLKAMKKLISLLSLGAVILLNSCGDNKKDETNSTQLPDGWIVLDLNEPGTSYGMPLQINIPGKDLTKGEASIQEGPSGGTQIIAGNMFNIEILPAAGEMAIKKSELENDMIFTVSYITDTPEILYYTLEIPGEEIKQHHFIAMIKAGNLRYEISNVKDEEYSEALIKMMIESAKSIQHKSHQQHS